MNPQSLLSKSLFASLASIGLSTCALSAWAECENGASYYPYMVETGYGTVLEARTGLEWQQCDVGQVWAGGSYLEKGNAVCQGTIPEHSWRDEKGGSVADMIRSNRFAGFADWRLPTKEEMDRVVDQGCEKPVINPMIATNKGIHWISVVGANKWVFNFETGESVSYGDTPYPGRYIRLVRVNPLLTIPSQIDPLLSVQKNEQVLAKLGQRPIAQRMLEAPPYVQKAALALRKNEELTRDWALLPLAERALAAPAHTRIEVLGSKKKELLIRELLALPVKQRMLIASLPDWQYVVSMIGFSESEKQLLQQEGAPNDATWQAQIERNVSKRQQLWLNLSLISKPAEIALPQLPDPISLTQEKFETRREFEQRVIEEEAKRNAQVAVLQAKYRKAVEARNKAVDDLLALQEVRKKNLTKMRAALLTLETARVLADVTINGPELDQETGDVIVTITKGGKFVDKFFIKGLDKATRQAMFSGYAKAQPSFEIDAKNDGSFGIKGIKVVLPTAQANQAIALTGTPTSVQFAPATQLAAVVGAGSNNNALANVKKQNPNLVDKFEIGQVVYKDGSTAKVKYQDDIAPLVAAMAAKPADPKKWLVVIGAEKYQNTDSIMFAESSAKLFEQAAQKALGILQGKTIALYNEQATGSNIKGQLKRLIESGVQAGDSLVLYYNGHGIPVPDEDNQAYMLPTDAVPDYIADDKFFRLSNLYKMLADSKLAQITIVMDSCFTGQTDGKSVFKGSKAATALVPKKFTIDDKRMAILTAGSDKQYSNAFEERGHRMFSYFVIKSLATGRTTVQDVYQEAALKVRDETRKGGAGKWQDPQVAGNQRLGM